jgi:hypothetical protein
MRLCRPISLALQRISSPVVFLILSYVLLSCATSYHKASGAVVHHGLGKEAMTKQRKKRCRYVTERPNGDGKIQGRQ